MAIPPASPWLPSWAVWRSSFRNFVKIVPAAGIAVAWSATFLVAAICFAAFAFRSDHMLDTWIPYHRSFVADVAQLVRQGYWLLWDIPSLYGFLSVLTVAIMPTSDAWQGLFLLSWRDHHHRVTHHFLDMAMGSKRLAQRCICNRRNASSVWRQHRTLPVRRSPLSTRSATLPVGDRGSSSVAFLLYVWRDHPKRVQYLRGCGHAIWLVSLFWSFETAVWSTAIWLPFLVIAAFSTGLRAGFKRLMTTTWPIFLLPILALIAIEVFYRVHLGHGPDFFGYVEFTGAFVSGSVRAAFPINPDGAGWSIVLTLASAGCMLVCLVRDHRWDAVPPHRGDVARCVVDVYLLCGRAIRRSRRHASSRPNRRGGDRCVRRAKRFERKRFGVF